MNKSQEDPWGLLASSLAEKMGAPGQGEALPQSSRWEVMEEDTQSPLLARTHHHAPFSPPPHTRMNK